MSCSFVLLYCGYIKFFIEFMWFIKLYFLGVEETKLISYIALFFSFKTYKTVVDYWTSITMTS